VLAALDGPPRRRAFLRAWAVHEATLKWRFAWRELAAGPAPPWTTHWDLASGAAALALDEAPGALRLWLWEPAS
jgi:hypothetical protein